MPLLATAALALADLEGRPQDLAQYRGRIVVLNFWATWCAPCVREMPVLAGVRQRYASRGVEVVTASADDESTRGRIPRFLRRHKIELPVWFGATTAHMEGLGLGHELPATAILDRDGEIVARLLGEIQEDDLVSRLDWLLSDRRGPAPPALVNRQEDHEEHEHGTVALEGASMVPS